jgi:hypothetical protein
MCWGLQDSFPFPVLRLWNLVFPSPEPPSSPSQPPHHSPLPSCPPTGTLSPVNQVKSAQTVKKEKKKSLHSWRTTIFQCPLLQNHPFSGVERRAAKNLCFCLGVQEGAREALFVELRRDKFRSQKMVSSWAMALERVPRAAQEHLGQQWNTGLCGQWENWQWLQSREEDLWGNFWEVTKTSSS